MIKSLISLSFLLLTLSFSNEGHISFEDLKFMQKHITEAANMEIQSIEEFKECVMGIDPEDGIVDVELEYCYKNKEEYLKLFLEKMLLEEKYKPWDKSCFIKLNNNIGYCKGMKCSCDKVKID